MALLLLPPQPIAACLPDACAASRCCCSCLGRRCCRHRRCCISSSSSSSKQAAILARSGARSWQMRAAACKCAQAITTNTDCANRPPGNPSNCACCCWRWRPAACKLQCSRRSHRERIRRRCSRSGRASLHLALLLPLLYCWRFSSERVCASEPSRGWHPLPHCGLYHTVTVTQPTGFASLAYKPTAAATTAATAALAG